MAEHRLWTEWHLTPCGWVRGSEKSEIGSVFEVEPAVERVLTCRYEEEYEGDGEAPVRARADETWRAENPGEVGKLMRIFGECPRNL
jgi:hypothetical protein